MKAFVVATVVGLCAATAAQAQLLDGAAAPQMERKPVEPEPFGGKVKPVSPGYVEGGTRKANANPGLSYSPDPRVSVGARLSENAAIEVGHVDTGTRPYADLDGIPPSPLEPARARIKADSTYVAGKLSVPVGERIEAYGKVGMAYSERQYHDRRGTAIKDVDAGPYAGVGADYKVSGKASVTGKVERFGDTGKKWGAGSGGGANGVSAGMKLGF